MTEEEARQRVIEMQKKWPRPSYKLVNLMMIGAVAVDISIQGVYAAALVAGGLVGAAFGFVVICSCVIRNKRVAVLLSLLGTFGFCIFPLILLVKGYGDVDLMARSVQFTISAFGSYLAGMKIAARIGAEKLGIQ